MPHFILDCSSKIIDLKDPEETMSLVIKAAESTGLFESKDIKVRLNPYMHYNTAGSKDDFIHVFGHIMEGRDIAQKSNLSKSIIRTLKASFPEVPVISMNIRDFEKATYCNKPMV